ncbi:hypothetical protein DE4585_04776 [Mycobacteroides salmoniphilum]|uniref:Uncharacterized protein n=1 Tax=Mycobacteroides salmoniphilum TaxID=404941 RepID=A0A4R8RZG6_9MYCO|nr:hypothetical protein [Mycobacteroides salmoniphilum]TDZ77382.1 hypothetical protein DE4585_04776 [Mycobacteroides salmoniphilum]
MTVKTKTRLTAQLAARRMEVAVIQKQIPPAALQMASDLLAELDRGHRIKSLEGRVREVLDAGYRAGALAVAAADGSTKDTRRAVRSIRAVAQLSDQLFGKPDEVKPPADSKPETSPNDDTEPNAVSDTEIEPESSTQFGD